MISHKHKTILLVESEALVSMRWGKELKKYGYVVIMPHAGECATEVVKNRPDIDILLIDIEHGKKTDGEHTARKILKIKDLPIIFLCTDGEARISEKAEDLVCDGLISKSISITVLDATLKLALQLYKRRMKEIARTEELACQAAILDKIGDHVTATDPDGKITYVNEAKCKALGKKKEEIIGKTHALFGTASDITRRKQMEEDLVRTVEEQRFLLDNIPTQIWYLKDFKTYGLVNQAHADFFGLTKEELEGKNLCDLMRTRKEVEASLAANFLAFSQKQKVYNEEIVCNGNGEKRHLSISRTPKLDRNNNVEFLVCAAEDITRHKLAEQAIQKSLEEKDVLLSEIHHRVKNNMAIISGMITLQTQYFNKKDRDKLLKDIQARIESMAIVHEMVYENENFTEINSGKLLERLADHLQNIYALNNKDISVQIRAQDIMLDMNKSVPFTLLVSEVMTNAWIHAFTDRKTGLIEVVLKNRKNGYRLVVQDDGKGVADMDQLHNPESFGYTIIHGLTQQLRGQIDFSSPSAGGLKVEAWFPEKIDVSSKMHKQR